jgi:hypothetical protein
MTASPVPAPKGAADTEDGATAVALRKCTATSAVEVPDPTARIPAAGVRAADAAVAAGAVQDAGMCASPPCCC